MNNGTNYLRDVRRRTVAPRNAKSILRWSTHTPIRPAATKGGER